MAIALAVKVGTDTAECMNMMIAGFRQCRDLIEKESCSSNMKPRLRANCVVSIEIKEFPIFAKCRLSPIRRNSVLEELSDKRLEVNQGK